jgi:hypothetical protein
MTTVHIMVMDEYDKCEGYVCLGGGDGVKS